MIVAAVTNHVLELRRSGKLKVLAVTHGTRLTARRAADCGGVGPDRPGDARRSGVFAPAGTPKPIKDQVAQANVTLLKDPAISVCWCPGRSSRTPAWIPKPTGATSKTRSCAGRRSSRRWS